MALASAVERGPYRRGVRGIFLDWAGLLWTDFWRERDCARWTSCASGQAFISPLLQPEELLV